MNLKWRTNPLSRLCPLTLSATCSAGEVHDFVCNKLLPSGQETLSALTEPEQTAARFLFCALIGYLKEEAPMDEQSFPMVMEMLNYAEARKRTATRT